MADAAEAADAADAADAANAALFYSPTLMPRHLTRRWYEKMKSKKDHAKAS